ncbi:MAG: Modification methylase DpnIIB [Syntrophus sp. PtaB.Bin001]|nr:MAG: Modification methylase DpnIIB [Syntrophus sp. PtaB.Bin001]
MARKKSTKSPIVETAALDYRHEEAKRKNIPPAGLAAQGRVQEKPKIQYFYDPHLPPVLRFDATGESDKLPELLEQARRRPLNSEEIELLASALRNREPWLEWSGKRERKAFEVDPVALHIHERISAQAILRVIARQDVQRDLFADPQMEYSKAVQFYRHDVDWSNRMILGDSLSVMASLARREDLAGKVQTIYMDPPYGIKFASNFQPEIGKRDVKDRESDLTREPEMVKAYRDTWTLGVHSYLAYLRDRLILCKELLADSGSIFVQISDENLHRVRAVLDEIFQPESFVSVITVKKTGGMGEELIDNVSDYILWYAKDRSQVKYKALFLDKKVGEGSGERYSRVELSSGEIRPLLGKEINDPSLIPDKSNVFLGGPLTSQTPSESTTFEFEFEGRKLKATKGGWKTNLIGMNRLIGSGRLLSTRDFVNYKMLLTDFPATSIGNLWADTMGTAEQDKKYVVQTTTKVIQRCLLMTTDPGDLVLDPTCGSGTTAYVAEQWGRRWITIDTSRVALALARQRLLTATFPFYRVREDSAAPTENCAELIEKGETIPSANPQKGFLYKTVPHITLKSIAQNTALDGIFARHQPILDERLAGLNAALAAVTPAIREKLQAKLAAKERTEGRKAVTDADRRRWNLPKKEWKAWEVPFDTDPDWPEALKNALTAYRLAWRAKMDEVNACIAAHADQEELVDQPEVIRNIARVSGPFSMEAVMPAEESLTEPSPIGGSPEEELGSFEEANGYGEAVNAEAHLDKMRRLLQADGIRFPDNKVLSFTRLDACSFEFIHAEGEWRTEDGETHLVAVSFGPQFGPVTAWQVEQALPVAARRGFQDLVFAGFSFDAAAQAIIQEDPNPNIRCHLAHISPDVNMGNLLKETPGSQLFTVFGSPRTRLIPTKDDEFIIEMDGVDIYDPVNNTILPTRADKVAAWFLDADYDGRTFCITQAFFPDKSAWGKIGRALKGVLDEGRFAALSGTVSLPFPKGRYSRAAVKVIDPRGNEVMAVHRLNAGGPYESA